MKDSKSQANDALLKYNVLVAILPILMQKKRDAANRKPVQLVEYSETCASVCRCELELKRLHTLLYSTNPTC